MRYISETILEKSGVNFQCPASISIYTNKRDQVELIVEEDSHGDRRSDSSAITMTREEWELVKTTVDYVFDLSKEL